MLRNDGKGICSPLRGASPSPSRRALPPLPGFMSHPALLEDGESTPLPAPAASPSGGAHPRLASGEARPRASWLGAHHDKPGAQPDSSDESETARSREAASVISGRSTVVGSHESCASSRAQSPRHWPPDSGRHWGSDTDSCRDDDSMSMASSVSSISTISTSTTCSERSPSGPGGARASFGAQAASGRRPPRPHTAVTRHSIGSIASSLEQAHIDLSGQRLERHPSGGEGGRPGHDVTWGGEDSPPGAKALAPLRMQAEFECIFSKARHGRYKEVSELLEAGALVDGVDGRGNTPLHAACQGGSLKTVKALLRRGCETNAQNHQGNTPLHYALAYRYQDVAEYLLRKGGALSDIRNAAGLTASEGLGTKSALERPH